MFALMIGLAASSVMAQTVPSADSPWRERFERARAALVEERFAVARGEFESLEASAQTDSERALAHELAQVARLGAERKQQAAQPEVRSDDELAVLYTSAALYGLGTGGMLALQFEPQTLGGALLPFAVLTPASIGAVALIDSYKRFAHGVPHAIAAGIYLGFGAALWPVGYQHAHATHGPGKPWGADRVSLVLWAGSTAGAVAGGLLGVLRRPTPGRVSFTASAAIWAGVITAFASSAIDSRRDKRAQTAYLLGGIGYGVGLLSGIAFGPSLAPSAARVRFIDLGGLGGALLGAGGYALVSHVPNSRGALGAAAIGGALGLGIAWFATSEMAPDHSHDRLRPALFASSASQLQLQPILAPLPGGFLAGVAGRL
jgi:hypothetical protein